MNVIVPTDDDFAEVVLEAVKPVIVCFYDDYREPSDYLPVFQAIDWAMERVSPQIEYERVIINQFMAPQSLKTYYSEANELPIVQVFWQGKEWATSPFEPHRITTQWALVTCVLFETALNTIARYTPADLSRLP